MFEARNTDTFARRPSGLDYKPSFCKTGVPQDGTEVDNGGSREDCTFANVVSTRKSCVCLF